MPKIYDKNGISTFRVLVKRWGKTFLVSEVCPRNATKVCENCKLRKPYPCGR